MPERRKFKFIFILVVFAYTVFCVHGTLYSEEQSLETVKNSALAWINQIRAQKGVRTLTIDSRLNEIAKIHSEKMAVHGLLSENDPALGSPFERIRSSGLTDINNQVVVVKSSSWDLLREQLESQGNLAKIFTPEISHMGIGIVSDPDGDMWLTIHMIERAITFTQFNLSQTNATPAKRTITIKGNTFYKKIKVLMVPPEEIKQNLALEQIVIPDSNGDFEITLSFGISTGNFEFEFSVPKEDEYIKKNSFSMNIG